MNWRAIPSSRRRRAITPTLSSSIVHLAHKFPEIGNGPRKRKGKMEVRVITMRDRSKNRKPLQRGRNLSIEAIQTIQALKQEPPPRTGFLLPISNASSKVDRMAVLDLKVFEDVRKEYWYKPQVSLYAEIISVLGSNGLYERVVLLYSELKMETGLEPDRALMLCWRI